MADKIQTYQNHFRLLPPFHFFVLPVLFLNVLNQLRYIVATPTLDTIFGLIVAAALLMLALLARVMALRVQDRVIRLEMRLRLRELLTGELKDRIHDLRPGQLVALRFASDAELPELVRDVLNGTLATPKAIKMRIRAWQPDWLRA